jgi:hypothetical protein
MPSSTAAATAGGTVVSNADETTVAAITEERAAVVGTGIGRGTVAAGGRAVKKETASADALVRVHS